MSRNPGTAVHIDAGHSNWVSAEEMAPRLRVAGIERAMGLAILPQLRAGAGAER